MCSSAVYSVQFAVYRVHCSVYSSAVYIVQFPVCRVHCSVCSSTVYSVQFAVYRVHCSVCSAQCTEYSVKRAVCRVLDMITEHYTLDPPMRVSWFCGVGGVSKNSTSDTIDLELPKNTRHLWGQSELINYV